MSESSQLTLVLGHSGSGKSLWAESEALRGTSNAIYVATAQLFDEEMRAKVALHAARRGIEWTLVEEPLELSHVCEGFEADASVLIDCVTLWLTNLMMADRPWEAEAEAVIAAMAASGARFTMVSNDVGGGITPDNALARRFQRAQGALNQRLASAAQRVVLVTAGLPLVLK